MSAELLANPTLRALLASLPVLDSDPASYFALIAVCAGHSDGSGQVGTHAGRLWIMYAFEHYGLRAGPQVRSASFQAAKILHAAYQNERAFDAILLGLLLDQD